MFAFKRLGLTRSTCKKQNQLKIIKLKITVAPTITAWLPDIQLFSKKYEYY